VVDAGPNGLSGVGIPGRMAQCRLLRRAYVGSTQQYGRAGLTFVKQQWETKREFALNADKQSRAELEKVLHAPSKHVPQKMNCRIKRSGFTTRTPGCGLT